MLVWTLVVVRVLNGEGDTKFVALWEAATLIRGTVVNCVFFWGRAFKEGFIK